MSQTTIFNFIQTAELICNFAGYLPLENPPTPNTQDKRSDYQITLEKIRFIRPGIAFLELTIASLLLLSSNLSDSRSRKNHSNTIRLLYNHGALNIARTLVETFNKYSYNSSPDILHAVTGIGLLGYDIFREF